MIPALQSQAAIPGAVLFASQPPLPRFRISTRVRKENREATRDAEILFQSLFLSHVRFMSAVADDLLAAGQLLLSH